MSLLYQSEYDSCKGDLEINLNTYGIPKILQPNYVRLMAEEIACCLADEISAEQYQKQLKKESEE